MSALFPEEGRAQNSSFQFTNAFYVRVPNSSGSSLNFTTDTFTIEAWIRPYFFAPTANSYEHTIVGNDSTTAAGGGYSFRTGGSRKLSFYFSYGSGSHEITTAAPVLVKNRWQHVAVTKQAGDVKLFVDGILVASQFFGSNSAIIPSRLNVNIGENGSLLNRKFNGRIDELKIWGTARTQAQIRSDGTESCGAPPSGLRAYYQFNDVGLSAMNPVACANNASLNGSTVGYIQPAPGALLFPGGTTELYVDSSNTRTGCASNAGYSWATAFRDLSTALEQAHLNHQIEKIHVAKGVYFPGNPPFEMIDTNVSRKIASANRKDVTFHVRPGLELYGGYPSGGGPANPALNRTVLDGSGGTGATGDSAYCVVYIDTNRDYWIKPSDTTKLIGFSVTNGKADQGPGVNGGGSGGGILCMSGTSLVQNCRILNNKADIGGGGIFLSPNATLAMSNDTVISNEDGISNGGFGGSHGGHLLIRDSYVAHNKRHGISSYQGLSNTILNNVITENEEGGIWQMEASSNITGNLIRRNGVYGIFIYQSDTCHIEGNVISDHNATRSKDIVYRDGGAIFLRAGKQTVIRNLITRDTATAGGGIYMYAGRNTVTDNQIIGNVAASGGGGIWCAEGTNTFINNLIKDNGAPTAGGIGISAAWNTVLKGNIIVGNTASVSTGGAAVSGQYLIANNVFAYNKAPVSSAMYAGTGNYVFDTIANNTFFRNDVTGTQYTETGTITLQGDNHVANNIFWRNRVRGTDTARGADFVLDFRTISCRFQHNWFQLPAASYSATGSYSLGSSSAHNRFAIDPQFADTSSVAGPDGKFGTRDDGLQLAAGSPLLDSGNRHHLPTGELFDVKADPRVYGKDIDPGAYELNCAPGNATPMESLSACMGTRRVLRINTAAPSSDVFWYADSNGTSPLGTGYTFMTQVLYRTDTFWVGTTGCYDSARTLITVQVPDAPMIQRVDSVLSTNPGAAGYQWMLCNPYRVIPGANSPEYRLTQNGSYTVVVARNGCADTAACVDVSALDVANAGGSELEALTISPNPAVTMVSVWLPAKTANGVLCISNMQGQIICRVQAVGPQPIILDVSRFPAGLYHVAVTTNGVRCSSARLVKY